MNSQEYNDITNSSKHLNFAQEETKSINSKEVITPKKSIHLIKQPNTNKKPFVNELINPSNIYEIPEYSKLNVKKKVSLLHHYDKNIEEILFSKNKTKKNSSNKELKNRINNNLNSRIHSNERLPNISVRQATRKTSNSKDSDDKNKIEYIPYTLEDYKAIKPEKYINLGGLGPNIGTKDWEEKMQRREKVKNYISNISSPLRNNEGQNLFLKPSFEYMKSSYEIKKKFAKIMRGKALEYSKNIPRPSNPETANNNLENSSQSHIEKIKQYLKS